MNRLRYLAVFFGVVHITCLSSAQTPAPPDNVGAVGYDSHIVISWTPSTDASVTGYRIFRSTNGGATFDSLGFAAGQSRNAWIDWVGDEGSNLSRLYQVKSLKNNGLISSPSPAVQAETRVFNDEELLDMVQEHTFRYFWDYGHPVSGMARERNNGDPNIVTTGGSGFGIQAILTGAERGWVTREAAVDRMIQIVSFLQFADRFHGVFPHWMNGANGNVVPFSQYDNGADLVETAFLMQGLLTARQYFNLDTPLESALRDAITGLWEDVEWDWFRKNNGPVLYWHWSPNYQWQMNFALRGFYEAQIVYILAAASPTHPVPGSLYQSGWTANANYCTAATYFGLPVYCGGLGGGPMFFAHYSYMGFDPRGWKDFCCNYFIRNRNHALIQWEYAKANPESHTGYSAECWGLTACDIQNGYSAHDIANDGGTIAPTAALASMPYTPDQSMAALKFFYRQLGADLWGPYGFYDAFNLDQNWFAESYLAIDQGPIIGMIENHRSGLLWHHFMQNPEIAPALLACGFQVDNSVSTHTPTVGEMFIKVFPNPAAGRSITASIELLESTRLEWFIRDLQGRFQKQLYGPTNVAAGMQQFSFDCTGIAPGVYLLGCKQANGRKAYQKIIIPAN